MECGDENTKLFQKFYKGRNMGNTIWNLEDQEGDYTTTFGDLSQLVKNHFGTLFKAE